MRTVLLCFLRATVLLGVSLAGSVAAASMVHTHWPIDIQVEGPGTFGVYPTEVWCAASSCKYALLLSPEEMGSYTASFEGAKRTEGFSTIDAFIYTSTTGRNFTVVQPGFTSVTLEIKRGASDWETAATSGGELPNGYVVNYADSQTPGVTAARISFQFTPGQYLIWDECGSDDCPGRLATGYVYQVGAELGFVSSVPELSLPSLWLTGLALFGVVSLIRTRRRHG
jgi:hypothetical protein